MKEKIIEAYDNLVDGILEMGYVRKVQVVIKIRPGAFIELANEAACDGFIYQIEELPELSFTNLYGMRIPITIDNTIPEDIEFVMQLREDYEREEHIRLSEKLFKMFGGE